MTRHLEIERKFIVNDPTIINKIKWDTREILQH